jgi:hypothetical protein
MRIDMRRIALNAIMGMALAVSSSHGAESTAPNVILILADDK